MVHIDLYFRPATNLGQLVDGGCTFYAMETKTQGKRFMVLAHIEPDGTIVIPSLHPGTEAMQAGADYFSFLAAYSEQTTELGVADMLKLLKDNDARQSVLDAVHEAHLELVEKIRSYLIMDIAAEMAA